jgi:hypothetical protein
MKNSRKRNASYANGTRSPSIGSGTTGREETVAAKSEGISRREAKKNHLGCKYTCGEKLWMAVDTLEIVLFAA